MVKLRTPRLVTTGSNRGIVSLQKINAHRPSTGSARSWTRLLGFILLLPLFAACLGRATPPDQVKLTQAQNEVLGKFARQVGEKELNILLNDPNDANLPGLPVGDLLYILSNVSEDKLIQLVKGIGATTTLELILAIKRIGCTRANNHPTAGAHEFNATINAGTIGTSQGINYCTWNEFHLPNIMVQLLAGMTSVGLTTLIDSVKHSYTNLNCPIDPPGLPATLALPANTPLCTRNLAATYANAVSHHQYLMKLAYVVVSFDIPTSQDPRMGRANLNGPRKLYEVMNMALDGRDMVYLLDSFDRTFIEAPGVGPATCPDATVGTLAYPPVDRTIAANGPTYKCVRVADGLGTQPANTLETYNNSGDLWADIEFGYQLGGMKLLLDIMVAVTDGTKMGVIINGRRTTRYLTSEDEAQVTYYVDKLKILLEHSRPGGCTFPGTGPETLAGTEQFRQNYASPHGGDTEWTGKIAKMINNITNVNRMMDLVYDIDISGTCPNRGIDNLLVMLNNINDTDAHPAINGYVLAPDDTTINNEVITAAYLIDNVPLDSRHPNPAKRNKVRYLIENLGNTLDMLKLTCYSAPADNNVATAEVCDGRGLLNQVASRSKFADPYSPAPTFPAAVVSDTLAGGKKLVNLTREVYDMNDMKFLIKHVSMDNMSQLIGGLQIAGTARVADLVNQISGDDCWNENNGLIKAVGPYNVTAAKITGNVSGGVLTSVTVVSPGANYPPGSAIAGFPGCTTQPVVQLTFSGGPTVGGSITGASVTSGGAGCTDGAAQPARFYEINGFPSGSGYNVTSVPTVAFGGIGAGAIGKAVVELDNTSVNYGKIMDVIILNSGSGYAPPGTAGGISFTPNNGGANIVASTTQGAFSGSCRYFVGGTPATNEFRGFPSPNGTGALGLGKMVNIINHLSGSINNLVTLINGVTDASQLGILINGISRSSNLVGVMNATIDTNRQNNANINDLMNLLNATPIVDTYKLIHMMDNLGNAIEADATTTLPGGDHDMVAQLIASYCRSDLAGLASATCPATAGNYVHKTSGVGYAAMANLVKSLTLTGGGGYTDGTVVSGLGGSEGILNVGMVSAVTGIRVVTAGSGCGSVTVTLSGGGGSGASAAAYVSNGTVSAVNILNSGSGYATAPAVSFTGCSVAPTATAYINGIGTVTVTKAGTGLNDSFVISPGGGTGGVITATVSGPIATLRSISGGTRYKVGQVCPLKGAGGAGATCTVSSVDNNGGLLGCTIANAGDNYADERIVKIGGRAEVIATVNSVTQQITGYTVVHGGCGYSNNAPSYWGAPYAAPAVQIVGCTTPPAATATVDASGVVTGIAGIGGTGCTSGVKVIIGESPYAYHADGGSAIVNSVTATGRVTSMSVSNASINAAQLVQLLDRDATGSGIAFNYRADDTLWSPSSGCSNGAALPCPAIVTPGTDLFTLKPNVSTREIMVRLLHHGFTPTTTSSKAFFNGAGGIGPGNLSLDWPGVGPQYIAGSILNNVTGDATQTLVNMMNSDLISFEDTILLLGCGDRSNYSNGWTTYSWQQLCTAVGPGLW